MMSYRRTYVHSAFKIKEIRVTYRKTRALLRISKFMSKSRCGFWKWKKNIALWVIIEKLITNYYLHSLIQRRCLRLIVVPCL